MIFLVAPSAWAALNIDATKSAGRSTSGSSISVSAFSTASGGDLLLAFVAADGLSPGMTVTGVSGAGLTWVFVQRANGQLGTAEIWRAFASGPLANVTITANLAQSVAASITVVAFSGADSSGVNGSGAIGNIAKASASSGAPSASLVTTRDGSWIFGVGHDWDRAVARSAGANQTVFYSFLATIGDTFWVQRQNGPTPLSSTQVFINDIAPTTDRYNLSIVEVLPALSSGGGGSTYSISGSITPGTDGAGSTVTLRQNGATIRSINAGTGEVIASQICRMERTPSLLRKMDLALILHPVL